MTLLKNKRPPAHAAALSMGRLAEGRLDYWLTLKGIPHVWNNEAGESGNADFTLKIGAERDIECEAKRLDYAMKYADEGIDFLAVKVDKYPPDTLYVLDIEIGFYCQSMANLKKFGERIVKRTRRGYEEEFIRVLPKRLAFIKYVGVSDGTRTEIP